MTQDSKGLVLVTGISGFIASHVAKLLLDEGYAVRGTFRGGKLEELKSTPVAQNPRFELVQVDDIATNDLTEAMKDVKFVMHIACPLAGQTTAAESLRTGIQGTLNVLKHAVRAGISKVVLTSSWATVMDPPMPKLFQDVVVSESDWGTATEAEVLAGDKSIRWVYNAVKLLSENAAWKFAKENPSIDLATINPPFVYGPLAEGFLRLAPEKMGAMTLLFSLLNGAPGRPLPAQIAPIYCDVRDVARAHVNALAVQPAKVKEDKRFLILGGSFTWPDVVKYWQRTRPELKDQLTSIENAPYIPPVCTTDLSRAKAALHIEDYIPWEQMVDDTIDSVLNLKDVPAM